MKLLREYIRELLLIESDEVDADGYIKGEDGKWYNPQGRKQWELPWQFKKGRNLGRIRYYPDEDGTWTIKPPSPIPSKYNGVEGYVLHAAYEKNGDVKYGSKVAGVDLHAGQSAEWWEYPKDGSIVVVHPELYQRDDGYPWFTNPEWVAYYKKALEKIMTLGGNAFSFAKFQGFIVQAQDPNSEWAKRLSDLGVAEGHTLLERYGRALLDPGDEDWVEQAKAAREGAKLQGLSFELFKWLGAHLDWMKTYYKKSISDLVLLELLDVYEESQSAPKPDLEDDATATKEGKELALKLADAMYMPVFAKGFAKIWRKLNISPREEIRAFSKYARGNRTDGYTQAHDLLRKHDETTYPSGIIYEIPDEAYAALAREYYS